MRRRRQAGVLVARVEFIGGGQRGDAIGRAQPASSPAPTSPQAASRAANGLLRAQPSPGREAVGS